MRPARPGWPVARARWFLRRMRAAGRHECTVLGRSFAVERDVFSPQYSRSTEFFAAALLPHCHGKTPLEIGSGCGAVSVLAALAGARSVTAVDVNPNAVECTRANIRRHHVADTVTVRSSPAMLRTWQAFDVVFFALPYVFVDDVEPFRREFGDLTCSCFDERYTTQRAFFKMAARVDDGSLAVYAGFGVPGDLSRFHRNLAVAGLDSYLVAAAREGRGDNRLYRLSRRDVKPRRAKL